MSDTTQAIPSTVIAHPGQDVELLCAVTSSMIQSVSWLINDMGPYEVTALLNGTLTGYSSNSNNLIVQNVTMNDVRNGSNYSCVINIAIAILRQNYPTTLYVAGECHDIHTYVQFTCTYTYCMYNAPYKL